MGVMQALTSPQNCAMKIKKKANLKYDDHVKNF